MTRIGNPKENMNHIYTKIFLQQSNLFVPVNVKKISATNDKVIVPKRGVAGVLMLRILCRHGC